MQSITRVFKISIFFGIIVSIYLPFAVYYNFIFDTWNLENVKSSLGKTSPCHETYDPKTAKKILFWTTMFGFKTFYMGDDDFFRDCVGIAKNCFATHERSYASIEDFDAVLFHAWNFKKNDVPSTRREAQNYVFVNLESPLSLPITYEPFDVDFFNLTMTYRLDSDIVWPYGYIRKIEDKNIVAPKLEIVWNTTKSDSTDASDAKSNKMESASDQSEMTKRRRSKKTKAIAWIVSNCKPRNGRDNYVRELAKFIDVDIYGKCGKEKGCPKDRDCFREVIEPNYYFYLSFENSMCQDYVTEKLYKAMMYNVVPIVYGGANYSLFAPPKSYINTLDFDSPEQLAVYLKRLISEPVEYEKYLNWKRTYEATRANTIAICRLCRYLHENNEPKSYSKLSEWYTNDKCPLQKYIKRMKYLTKKDATNRG